ncbi:MAG: TIGR04219 family outer membrane beta-barrel protein [Ferrimonas sp.]
MIKTFSSAMLLSLAAAVPAQADLFSVKGGMDLWYSDASGKVRTTSIATDNEVNASVFIAFEHPLPLIPNVRARFNEMETGNVDLSNIDLTLYYQLLDSNLIELDFGLNYRAYSGSFGTTDLDQSVLQAYGYGKVSLPGTGLFVYADVVGSDYDSKATSDYQVGLGFRSPVLYLADLSFKVGYREHHVDAKRFDGVAVDVTQNGWFAGVQLVF